MRRALRIALHPVVLVLVVIDIVGIGLLLASPSWGYRATITYGSMCDLVSYCYSEMGGTSESLIHNTSERRQDGLFVQDLHWFNLNCDVVGAVDNQTENGADQWLRCAARCTGNCAQVEKCIAECPDDMLVYGFTEACRDDLDKILDDDPMRPFLGGDFSVGDLRGKLRLASAASVCRGAPGFAFSTTLTE